MIMFVAPSKRWGLGVETSVRNAALVWFPVNLWIEEGEKFYYDK